MKRLAYVCLLLLITGTVLTGCRDRKTTGEKVEDSIEEVGDDIGDAVDDAVDEVDDAVND